MAVMMPHPPPATASPEAEPDHLTEEVGHTPPAPTRFQRLVRAWMVVPTSAVDEHFRRLHAALATVPPTWRRVLDPHGRGLTVPQLLRCRAARDSLTGRASWRIPPQTRSRGVSRRPRSRARRTGASSRTSSADPGPDGSDSDPPPPPGLRLRRHPRYGLCNSNLRYELAVVA